MEKSNFRPIPEVLYDERWVKCLNPSQRELYALVLKLSFIRGYCYMLTKNLAKRMGLHKDTVKKNLRILKKVGLIKEIQIEVGRGLKPLVKLDTSIDQLDFRDGRFIIQSDFSAE